MGNPNEPRCQNLLNKSRVTRVISPRSGICYTYNMIRANDTEPKLLSYSAGVDFGLSLLVNLEAAYYMRYGLSESAGISVIITPPGYSPQLIPVQYAIGPNTMTNLAIGSRNLTRKPAPYTSQCLNAYPASLIKTDSSLKYLAYNEEECKSACLIEYIQNKCHCIDPLLLEARAVKDIPPEWSQSKFCPVGRKKPERECVHNYTVEYMIDPVGLAACPCQPECTMQHYEVGFFNQIIFENKGNFFE